MSLARFGMWMLLPVLACWALATLLRRLAGDENPGYRRAAPDPRTGAAR